MQYIITEDEKSGFAFWKTVAKIEYRLKDKQILVYTSRGKGNMFNFIQSIGLKQGDKLLIALDNLGKEIAHTLFSIYTYCSSIGVHVKFTDYYSIEEAFISYSRWEIRCNSIPKKDSPRKEDINCCNAYDAVYKKIVKRESYDPKRMQECRGFILDKSLQKATKEHILTVLLSEYTSHSVYKVRNKEMSKCWLCDCCYIKKENGKKHFCNQNKNLDKNETMVSKFSDLGKNSIFGAEFNKV